MSNNNSNNNSHLNPSSTYGHHKNLCRRLDNYIIERRNKLQEILNGLQHEMQNIKNNPVSPEELTEILHEILHEMDLVLEEFARLEQQNGGRRSHTVKRRRSHLNRKVKKNNRRSKKH